MSAPEPDPQVVKLLLETSAPSLERQLRTQEGLDAKVTQLAAAAAIVAGLGATGAKDGGAPARILLAAALVAFLVVATTAISALWPRKYRVTLSADELWSRYWNDTVDSIRHGLMDDAAASYAANREHNSRKASCLKVCLAAMVAETVLVGAALLVA